MKKLLHLWAILAMVNIPIWMTGCGGGDDDDDGGAAGAAAGFAPNSASGRSVILIDDAASIPAQEVRFETSGNTFTAATPAGGETPVTGTFQYTKTGDNTATLVLSSSAGYVRTFALNFNSDSSGSYSYVSSDGVSGGGAFSSFIIAGPPAQPPPSGEQPPPSGEQPPPSGEQPPPSGEQPPSDGQQPPPGDQQPPPGSVDSGVPPAALSGRTVVFNVTSGPLLGATSVTFGAGNSFTASNSGSGTFSYTLSGTTANLMLDYTAPPDFVGDQDTFVMTFNSGSGTTGTFTGSTRIDEAESAHSGTFQIQ